LVIRTVPAAAAATRPSVELAIAPAAELGGERLAADQVLDALALPHDVIAPAVDEDGGGARPRVVVGGHHETIRAHAHHRQHVARLDGCQGTVPGEEVAALADRPDDVDGPGGAGARRADRPDLLVRVVQGGADEVVHRGVDDHEPPHRTVLQVEHPGEERAGVADERPPGLDDDGEAEVARAVDERGTVLGGRRRPLLAVGDPEPAAHVEVAERDAAVAQAADQHPHARERVGEGREARELRADVAVDADDLEVREARRARVDLERGGDVDSELALLHPRRDVRMGLGVDVGVDPQGDGRAPPRGGGGLLEGVELRGGLDVEHEDAGGERPRHLVARLADTGEDDPARVGAGALGAEELAARDDVEAAALARERAQDRQGIVRLDGVADEVGKRRQGAVVGAVRVAQRGEAVDVRRRADLVGDPRERDVLAAERSIALREHVGAHDGVGLGAGPCQRIVAAPDGAL
jgi:hypothetical protein